MTKLNKISLELGSVNKVLKLKFSILVNTDTDKKMENTVSNFTMNDVNYTRLNLHPFITFDIRAGRDKNDAWNSNMVINLNKINIFRLLPVLQEMINDFKIKDLYYYMENMLHVNTNLVKEHQKILNINGKFLCLIYDTHYSDNENKWYEVVRLCINKYDYYCKLTLMELKYLYYQLNKIDMDMLGLELYKLYIADSGLNVTYEKIEKTIDEIKSENIDMSIPNINLNKEIPDI